MAKAKDNPAAEQPGQEEYKVLPISVQDAQLILSLLGRVDLKGSEVPAFNRAQALIAHACAQRELPQEALLPPQPQQ